MISCFPAESMLHLVQWLFAICNHRRGDEGGSHARPVVDSGHHPDADGFAGGAGGDSGEAIAMDTETVNEHSHEDVPDVPEEEFEWVEVEVEVADEDEDYNEDYNTVETVDDNSEVPLSADVHLPPSGPNRKPKEQQLGAFCLASCVRETCIFISFHCQGHCHCHSSRFSPTSSNNA